MTASPDSLRAALERLVVHHEREMGPRHTPYCIFLSEGRAALQASPAPSEPPALDVERLAYCIANLDAMDMTDEQNRENWRKARDMAGRIVARYYEPDPEPGAAAPEGEPA